MSLLLLISSSAHAWGHKEHLVMTQVAAMRIVEDEGAPTGLRHFMMRSLAVHPSLEQLAGFFAEVSLGPDPHTSHGLGHWALYPDLRDDRDAIEEPWGIPASELHYIHLEVFHPRASGFKPDLTAKPTLEQVPRNHLDPRWPDAGMLPFRVQQCFDGLTTAFEDGRLHRGEDPAEMWAGLLAHFAQDNTQPHHATSDYQSASFFEDDGPNVHSALEWKGSDGPLQDSNKRAFFEAFVAALHETPAPVSPDPWMGTLQVANLSYDLLPVVGNAAAEATTDGVLDLDRFYTQNDAELLNLKAVQMAWAVHRTEALWRGAWQAQR